MQSKVSKDLALPNQSLIEKFTKNEQLNTVIFGYKIGENYSLAVIDTITQTKIKDVFISSTEKAFEIALDIKRKEIIVILTMGTIIILDFDLSIFKIKQQIIYLNSKVNYVYVDQKQNWLNIFFSDYFYYKINYSNSALLKMQNLNQVVNQVWIDEEYQIMTLVLNNHYLQLAYQEKQLISQVTKFDKQTMRIYEDNDRGIFILMTIKYFYVFSLYDSKLLLKVDIDSTEDIQTTNFKVSKQWDLISITTKTFNTYIFKYSTFSFVQKLTYSGQNIDATQYFCQGSEFDYNMNRLFIYYKLGNLAVWQFNQNTKMFVNPKQYEALLPRSSINGLILYPEKKLILILSNGWWSKLLNYDNLVQFGSEIPGFLGFFVNKLSLLIMHDQNGVIWIYNVENMQLTLNLQIHAAIVRFVLTAMEEDYIVPTIISGRKMYIHDSELINGFFDEKSQLIITSDKKGALQIFTFPNLSLKTQYTSDLSPIAFFIFIPSLNQIIYAKLDTSISILDYYTMNQPEYAKQLIGQYGINDVIQIGDQVYLADSFGLVSKWDIINNKMKFLTYQKRNQFQYLNSSIKLIPNTNYALVFFARQFLRIELSTYNIQQIDVNCISYEYFSDLEYITCINQNTVYLYNSQLILLTTIQIKKLSQNTIISVDINQVFMHIIIIETNGDITFYQYNQNRSLFTFFTTIHPLNKSKLKKKIIDPKNQLLILAYNNGELLKYDYQKDYIGNPTPINSYSFSSKTQSVVSLIVVNNKYLLVRRLGENFVVVFSYPSLYLQRVENTSDNILDSNPKRPLLLKSPCSGPDFDIHINIDFKYLLISCSGQYHLYSSVDLIFLAECREIYKITSQFEMFQTKKDSSLKFINESFFVDSFYRTIFFFKIDKFNQLISLIGQYHNNDSVNKLSNISLIQKQNGNEIYGIQMTIYSFISIEQVKIPLSNNDFCKLETNAQLFSNSLLDLEEMYNQMKIFSNVNKFKLIIYVSDSIYLPSFPSFKYSSISQLVFQPKVINTVTPSQRTKVYASPQFFLSASNYSELFMQNLLIVFQQNQQFKIVSVLTKPLQTVNLFQIDIQYNESIQQIQFQQISYVSITNMNIMYDKKQTSRQLQDQFQQQNNQFKKNFQSSLLENNLRYLQNEQPQAQIYCFKFSDILKLNIEDINIQNLILTDISIIEVINNGENISVNPLLKTAQIKLDKIKIQGNQIISTIPNYNTQYINSLITVSMIPNVEMKNFNITDNWSDNLSMQGIIQVLGVTNLLFRDSRFENNNNLFFLISNSTYSSDSQKTNYPEEFIYQKFYQIQNTSITMNSIFVLNNIHKEYIRNLIRINSKTLTCNQTYFINNKLQMTEDQFFHYNSFQIQNEISLISFLEIVQLNIDTFEIINNKGYQFGVVKIIKNLEEILNRIKAFQNQVLKSSLYLSEIQSMTISNSSFTNNQASEKSSSIYIIKSNIQLDNIDFQSEFSQQSGGSIYSEDSTLTFQNCNFNKIKSDQDGGAIYAAKSNIYIQNTNISNCLSSGSGGSIYLISSQLNFISSNITDSKSELNGGAIFSEAYLIFELNSSIVENCSAINGGAIYLKNQEISTTIKDSFIRNNKANGSGGGLMIDNSQIDVRNTSFQNNIAGYGGAIRYIGAVPIFLQKLKPQQLRSNLDNKDNWVIGENKFKNNTGYILGSEIGGVFTRIEVNIQSQNFEFIKLKDYTSKERIVNKSDQIDYQYLFNKFRSGEKNFQFLIELYDLHNQKINPNFLNNLPKNFILSEQILKEIENIRCKVVEIQKSARIEEQDISIDGSLVVDYKQSKEINFYGISLDNIQVKGVPGQKGSFCLQFDGLSRLRDNFTFTQSECINFQVDFRKCQRGEIYLPSCDNCIMRQCDICSNGTYSLIEPFPNSNQVCKICKSQYASNCISDQITLLPGYWRENQYSDEIFECDKKYDSCNGNQTSHYCNEGFIGPLCQTCDQNGLYWKDRYIQSSLYQYISCIKCSNITGQQIFFILSLIVTGVYLFFQIFSMNQSSINLIKGSILKQLGLVMVQNSLVKNELSQLSKLLIHYLTIQEIIDQFTIANKDFNDKVLSIPKELLFPVQNLFLDFDCYLSDPSSRFSHIPIEYARLIITFILCLLLLCFLIFLFGILVLYYNKYLKYSFKLIKHQLFTKSAIIGTSLLMFYFFQQTLTSSSLKVLTCRVIGDKQYILSQLNKECYTEEYFKWFPLLITTFILSAFFYPLILFLLLYKNRNKLNKTLNYRYYRRYGFLFSEFKNDCWWWEIMRMILRQIVIIVTQLSIFPLMEKVSIVLVLTFLQLILQLRKQPYRHAKLNQIDFMLNIFSIMIIILAIYQSQVQNDIKKIIISIIITLLKFASLGNNLILIQLQITTIHNLSNTNLSNFQKINNINQNQHWFIYFNLQQNESGQIFQ